MNRYCLTLDLKPDVRLIEAYIDHHRRVWPEILESIRVSGIRQMEIFHVATRLVMVIEAEDTFSFDQKRRLDAANARVAEWEALMDQYQQRLPFAGPEEKWVLMDKIFEL